MPRPKKDNVSRKVYLPREIMESVDDHLYDPFTQSIQHGSFSRLVTMLVRKWLAGEVRIPSPLVDKGEDDLNLQELTSERDTVSESKE